MQKQTMKYKRE